MKLVKLNFKKIVNGISIFNLFNFFGLKAAEAGWQSGHSGNSFSDEGTAVNEADNKIHTCGSECPEPCTTASAAKRMKECSDVRGGSLAEQGDWQLINVNAQGVQSWRNKVTRRTVFLSNKGEGGFCVQNATSNDKGLINLLDYKLVERASSGVKKALIQNGSTIGDFSASPRQPRRH